MHLLAWLSDKASSAPNSDDLASLCIKNWPLFHGSQFTQGILQVSQLVTLHYILVALSYKLFLPLRW